MKDPLLAELQGQAVDAENPNPVPQLPPGAKADIITEGQDPALHPAALAAAAAAEDPLALKPKIETRVQAADRVHATQHGGKGYAVTVKGNYFAPAKDAPGKRIVKPYELVFNVTQLEGCLSVIKNKLLMLALQKKHPECLGFQTHDVVSYKALGGAPESNHLAFMKRDRLESYVAENAVPVEPADYPDTEVLRAAIIDWTLNPKGFEEREKAKQADRAETKRLMELNPELAA